MTVERAFVLRLFSLDLGSWHGLAVKLSTSRRQEWSIARQTAVVRFSLEIRCVEPFELTDIGIGGYPEIAGEGLWLWRVGWSERDTGWTRSVLDA
jgi:hypothetical protein